MPTDAHGVTHAGALGLFDDFDENAAAIARSERHACENLETAIRRHERRAGRQHRRNFKATKRQAAGKSKLLWPILWLEKLFGGGKDLDPIVPTSRPAEGHGKIQECEASGFTVIRKPSTPEPAYTAQDVDPVDSPWSRECGMVRVKSDDVGGCHIVPKSSLQKSE
jgi:hypothetical protein